VWATLGELVGVRRGQHPTARERTAGVDPSSRRPAHGPASGRRGRGISPARPGEAVAPPR
jgi:hypothetical protein